jgi:AcrR family transcriptional regulator
VPKLTVTRSAERRQQFVEAAWRLLTRASFHDLTIDDVCSAARSSKGAFYSHFASKRELFYALLALQADMLDEDASDAVAEGAASLHRFAESAAVHAHDPSFVQLRVDVWAVASSDREARAFMARRVEARRTTLAGALERLVERGELRREVSSRALATTLIALADGLALHRFLDPAAFGRLEIAEAASPLVTGARPAEL